MSQWINQPLGVCSLTQKHAKDNFARFYPPHKRTNQLEYFLQLQNMLATILQDTTKTNPLELFL